jgi:hypothetical protein
VITAKDYTMGLSMVNSSSSVLSLLDDQGPKVPDLLNDLPQLIFVCGSLTEELKESWQDKGVGRKITITHSL